MPRVRWGRRWPILAVATLLGLSVPASFGATSPSGDDIVAGRVLVSSEPGVDVGALAAIAGATGDRPLDGVPGVFVLAVRRGRERTAAARLSAEDGVRWAAPDHIARAAVAPDDPAYQLQWNLGTRDRAPGAADWQPVNGTGPTGAGVTVAVLDSGVTASAELDQVSGYDFIDNDADPSDANGHGTHVAGTVAQTTGNHVGAAGIAPAAAILAVRVLDASGSGSYSTIMQGMTWALDHGARVINLSLAGDADGGLCDAVARAVSRGASVIVAAGNDNGPVGYPAACPSSIAVTATTLLGQPAPYANHGPQLAIAAPGGDTSADVDHDGEPDGILQYTVIDGRGGYYFFSGTSMAAPHVAGTAALLLQVNPKLTPAQVRSTLTSTAVDLGAPGPDATYGAGLLDIAAAVASVGGTTAPETRSIAPSATPPPATSDAPTPNAEPASSGQVERVSGANRYETSVLVSRQGWSGTAPRVYLVSGREFPDALASGALSGRKPGPVLLTEPCSLPSIVGDELARLSPGEVVVVGGERAVCTQVAVQAALKAQTTYRRIAGADRYATAGALAAEGWTNASTVYLASGAGFADALGGGAAAAQADAPLLLAGACALPDTTRDQLTKLHPSRVVVLGGASGVCDAVLEQVRTATNAEVTRVAGADRYDTSASLAALGWPGTSPVVFIASGTNFPDGLAAGPLAAVRGAPLLLVAPCSLPDPVRTAVSRLDPERVVVLGGTSSVCETVNGELGR